MKQFDAKGRAMQNLTPRQAGFAMPAEWAAETPAGNTGRARHVGDFIAGMTDRYALKTYARIIGPPPLPTDIFI